MEKNLKKCVYIYIHVHTHTCAYIHTYVTWWLGGKEYAYQCRRCRFNPWLRKIPSRRKGQPSPVFLPGKSREQQSLTGYSSVSSVQSLSHVWLFATPWTAAHQASLSITNSRSLPKPIESLMSSNHLILRRPLLLPSNFPSIRVFSNESVLRMRWPKYWSFSIIISPSNEDSELISLRMDWLALLAVHGTVKIHGVVKEMDMT